MSFSVSNDASSQPGNAKASRPGRAVLESEISAKRSGEAGKALGRRHARILSHPIFVAGLYGVGVVVLAWSLIFRLGGIATSLAVQARMVTARPLPELDGRALSEETLADLRRRSEEVRRHLVADRAEFIRLIGDLESAAMEEGWRPKLSVQSAVMEENIRGGVMVHPVTMTLERAPRDGGGDRDGAYVDCLKLLHCLQHWPKKIELQGAQVEAGPSGIQTVTLTFTVWSQLWHAQASTE